MTNPHLDPVDARLLAAMQGGVPLVARPFHAVGRSLGISGDEVLRRVRCLARQGIVRQIGAIFEAVALGYESTLVAVECPSGRRDGIAAAVNKHPGVSHNYARNHRFNLWFTIAVPPGVEIADEVARLMRRAGAADYVLLAARRVFKIGVMLDMGAESAAGAPAARHRRTPALCRLTATQIAAVRALQKPLPLQERPYRALARAAGCSEGALLARGRRLLKSGAMRRFAAVLRHRRVGYAANAMAVWQVGPGRIERAGRAAASFREVSHCYERATAAGWPYNLFAMIHGHRRAECARIAGSISRKIGNPRHALLFSTTEYKKARPAYFE